MRRKQLRTWTDRDVITNRDGCAVQQDRVVVDKTVCTDADVRPVVALESREYHRTFAQGSEQLIQQPSAFAVIVCPGRVERVKEALTGPPARDKIWVVGLVKSPR